jgi:hypothetical protein
MAKLAKKLATLRFGDAEFAPRTFEVGVSKNVAAQTVTLTFRVPVAEAQALVDAAKDGGAKVYRTEVSDYATTVLYIIEPNNDGTSVSGFNF